MGCSIAVFRYFSASLHGPPPSRPRFFKVSTCARILCNRSKYSSRVAWPITGSSVWPPVDTAGHRAGSNQRPVCAVQCVDDGRVLGACHTTPGRSPHGLYQVFHGKSEKHLLRSILRNTYAESERERGKDPLIPGTNVSDTVSRRYPSCTNSIKIHDISGRLTFRNNPQL